MSQQKILNKIPTNIITGFLGVGKTTTILNILKHKPADERWLVIVNEFGEVSIDHIAFEGTNQEQLAVKYVAGGCICCTANMPLQVTLTNAIRQIKPHRILIEPTGIAHPEALIDILQNEFLAKVIDLRATICLVNPAQLIQEKYFDDDTYQDQITLADVLLANKIDLAGEQLTHKFLEWAKSLFPPKIIIGAVEKGDIDLSWLDVEPYPNRRALYPDAHQNTETPEEKEVDFGIPLPGKPLRKESKGFGNIGCGWVFSPDEIFSKNKLLAVIDRFKDFERIKGAFRVSKSQWIFVNKTGTESLSECPIAYRKDSRAEFISSKPQLWALIEKELKSCLFNADEGKEINISPISFSKENILPKSSE